MTSKSFTLIAIAAIALTSCKDSASAHKFDKLQKMKWLVGQWENKTPDGLLTETWTKENDSTYTGKSYFVINEKDTVHAESIVLLQQGEDLIYRPTVKGQNNDEPVDFKLSSDVGNSFTFENPQHDFPQKIVYKKVNDNSLVATISGKQDGKPTTESYPMAKK